MMRYQRVSPDCLGLPNGRKPTIRHLNTSDSVADPFRVRTGSASGGSTIQVETQAHHDNYDSLRCENSKPQNHHHHVGGDVLLQWGQRKRSRGLRAENRTAADESSVQSRNHIKCQRRVAIGTEKITAAAVTASAMPPPCGSGASFTRGANVRACMLFHNSNRTVEEGSNGQHRPDMRSPPSPRPHKTHHHNSNKPSAWAAANGFGCEVASASMNLDSNRPSDQETAGSGSGGGGATMSEKVNLEQFEWPRIYISLSRKEKEDDFLAMKGTKLPQRPKKRAKNVDKSLQYCFPGLWLSDLTRGRYEVREKKCVKKKRRGLKGMESVDSDSE